jgi:hypothetical protein
MRSWWAGSGLTTGASCRCAGIIWSIPLPAHWRRAGRRGKSRAYADRIELRQDGRIVGEHRRAFGRDQTIYDPWHYVPVLARKPGALRNGAPFKDWVLPAGIEKIRRRLAGQEDGNRQMVSILTAVLSDGLPAVESACTEALREACVRPT